MATDRPNVDSNAPLPATSIQGGPVVHLPPPPQGAYVNNGQPARRGETNLHYRVIAGRTTGVIQICCGLVSVVLGIINNRIADYSHAGTGIWSGLGFFFIAGILGVVSARRSNSMIISYMVMSILCAVVVPIVIIIYTVRVSRIIQWRRDYGEAQLVLLILLMAVAIIEFLTSIYASIVCCTATCCAPSPAAPVVYYYQYQAVPPGYVVPEGMVVVPPQQAPPGAPSGTTYTQPPFPAAQFPDSSNPAAQWQPMVAVQPPMGAQPLPEKDPLPMENPPPYS